MKIQLHGGPFDQEWIEVEGNYQFYAFPIVEDLSVIAADKPHPDRLELKKAIYHYTKDGLIFDRMGL